MQLTQKWLGKLEGGSSFSDSHKTRLPPSHIFPLPDQTAIHHPGFLDEPVCAHAAYRAPTSGDDGLVWLGVAWCGLVWRGAA